MIVYNHFLPRILKLESIITSNRLYLPHPESYYFHQEINHKLIHVCQIRTIGIFWFYLFYTIEYLCSMREYEISFEREAYFNQYNLGYIGEKYLNTGKEKNLDEGQDN